MANFPPPYQQVPHRQPHRKRCGLRILAPVIVLLVAGVLWLDFSPAVAQNSILERAINNDLRLIAYADLTCAPGSFAGLFCDEDNSVHESNIETLAGWEITLGCEDNRFCPQNLITRNQMAAFLYRAVTRQSGAPQAPSVALADVRSDAWYLKFAQWAVSSEVMPLENGRFNPQSVVTRADMAEMMTAAFPDLIPTTAEQRIFTDTTGLSSSIVSAIESMYRAGVSQGCSTSPLRFCPDKPVTRAQMASFFVRALTGTPPQGEERPGAGVRLTMARANWSTGYFQAALFRALLQELGYEVSNPAELELGPSLAYVTMALGNADFWVNSWYPYHNSWLEPQLPDGSRVGDHISAVGEELVAGGLQGYLITKSFAERYGITTLDDLNNNRRAIAAFDAVDPVPGNGIADIYGCPEAWTCDDIIQSQIAFSGWRNIRQVMYGYDAMFAEAIAKANAGLPMVAYTWTPSSYITQLRPGDNVIWVGVEKVLDDSNPLRRQGGEQWDQRPGTAKISADRCPVVARLGTCRLGWVAADILVTARNDLLDRHPAARRLFEVVKLDVVDVSQQVAAQDAGFSPEFLAQQWIANHRGLVDRWLAAARAAA